MQFLSIYQYYHTIVFQPYIYNFFVIINITKEEIKIKMQPHKELMEDYFLAADNLLPIYLIEDKLKTNFNITNNFISATKNYSIETNKEMKRIQEEQEQMKKDFQNSMNQLERRIVSEISAQLDGRISVVVSKNIESFTEKLDKKDSELNELADQFDSKLEETRRNMKYQISQQNQKYIAKQLKRVQKKIADLEKNIKQNKIKLKPQTPRRKSSIKVESHEQINAEERKVEKVEATHNQQQNYMNNEQNWQTQHILIKQLAVKIQKIEEFNVDLDKRVYSTMNSVKQSWKQLGKQIIDNKKSANKRIDELKIEFVKLKNLKEFEIIPERIDDEFRTKITEKFTQIYQALSRTLTKNQYEGTNERTNKRINRHDEEIMEVRKEQATNSQYFTFYVNNADQQDLKQRIAEVKGMFEKNKATLNKQIQNRKQEKKKHVQSFEKLENIIKSEKQSIEKKAQEIDGILTTVNMYSFRIDQLQEFNRFGPSKMQKIHNMLDTNLSPSQQELIENQAKKSMQTQVDVLQKQFKLELSKMKDEIFTLMMDHKAKEEEIGLLKKGLQFMDGKIDRVKGETEEAMISRKPWVCLSCDKQQNRQKQTKKETKAKKSEPFKQGGFGLQKGSEKKLANTPPVEQKFEVYEKFREKYLSDTLKLPDIFRQKLNDNPPPKDQTPH